MRRPILLFVALFACGGGEPQKPPPQTVTLPQPADAGSASSVGNTLGEEPQSNPVGERDGGAVGTLSRDVIQKTVRAGLPRAKLCYESALRKEPGLKGRVLTRFVIDPSGHVSSAQSTDQTTMPNPDVVACVVGVFKSLVFPPPEGGSVTVAYPFVFQAADAED
jgi:hypothetical protein